MKLIKSVTPRFNLLFLAALLLCPTAARAVVFTVTPAAVSNTYNGTITLQVTGLTPGDTVVVQKYLDANTNGVVDAGDVLWQQFNLTDGSNFVIGGVTNINVPGDTDGTVNGQITAKATIRNDFSQAIVGQYLYVLSSPSNHFTPQTSFFAVTNFPYAQKITGTVASNGVPVPDAAVILFQSSASHELNTVGGTVANNSGVYTIQAPAGTYTLAAFKSNFVADTTAAANLVLSASATINTNLNLIPATQTISGSIIDTNSTNIGLPGILVAVESANGLLAVCSTGSNGNFTTAVNSNQWKISGSSAPLALHGYVGSKNKVQVSTLSGSVSNVTIALPQATALFYGTVLDSSNNPLTGVVAVLASDNNGQYEDDGYTDMNGNYAVGAIGGLSGDTWQAQIDNSSSFPNYVFSQPDFDQNGGTNISVDQAVQANFTATLASNSISGSLKDNSGNAITNVGIYANTTNGGNQNVNTDTNGNYSLNVGNGTWTVGVNNGGGNHSLSPATYLAPPNQTVVVANSNVTQLNFTAILASNTISGSLKDNSSNAIPNVGIYAYTTISNVNYNQNVNTDNSGNYSLGVINGSWTVGVNSCNNCGGSLPANYLAPTNQNQTVVITNNNPTVNFIAILATNTISGHVQYNGTNVVGVGVSASLISDNNIQSGMVDTDTNGNYSLNVTNGAWSVSVSCQGGGNSLAGIISNGNFICPNSTNVTIANDNVGGVNFNVQSPTTVLSGRVVDDGGNPVTNMSVFAFPTNGGGSYFQAATDSGGNFNMGIDGGNYTLELNNDTNSGYPALGLIGPFVPVSVTNGVNITNFILVAPRVTGAIQVQVNGSNNIGVSGIRVSANLAIGITNYSTSGQDLTGNSGAATLGVCNGTWTVNLNASDVTNAGYPVPPSTNTTISHNTNAVIFTLSNGGGSPLQVLTASLLNGVEGMFYSAQIHVTGGVPFTNAFPYNASLFSGSYPPGLTLSQGAYTGSSGYFILSGTPTNSGTYPFDVVVSDSVSNQVTNSYSVTIAPSYTIAVSASPTNGGTVSGGGPFAVGSTNTVTATANNGYIFTNWTSNSVVVSTSTNYAFILNANVALVANFVQGYTIAVSASPTNGGNVSGSGTFAVGGTNTVTATANNGYIFTNWTSNSIVVSTSNNYAFVLNTNVTLVANFLPLYTITVGASPTNGGTVGGNGTFAAGSTNTVTTTANGGYTFIDWTSNSVVVSTSNNYSFALNANVALVANFLPLYTITVGASPTNGGTVSGSGTFVTGSTNTVTATATNGYIFTNWTSNSVVVSISNNYTFTLNTNVTLVANFLPLDTITVSASPTNSGMVSGGGTFVAGSTNTVTATATNGFIFTDWTVSNIVVSTLANYSFTLSNNVTLVANFSPSDTITVSASPTNGGTVTGGGTFAMGSTNTVMATPTNGYIFTNWTSNSVVVSISNNYTFTLNTNVTLVANFLPLDTITVSASPTNSGMVSGGGTFVAGSTNTVTATATNGYIFTNWTSNSVIVSISNNYTFTLNTNVTLVANFLPLYTITVSASPAGGGTVSVGGTNGGVFPGGSLQTVTATTNGGFEFIGWSGDATGTNNPLMVTVNTNLNITANFATSGTNITVTVITNGDGTVLPNLNGKDLKAGRSYTLIATAARGNVFSNWTGTITTNKNPLTFKVESSMVLQANFIPNPFLPVKGTYNGLFTTTNGVTEQTAGMLKDLAVGQKGTYSGLLLINGGTHPIMGSFNLAGQATNKIARPASQGGPLTLVMELVTSGNFAPQVTGTVSGTNNGVAWVSTNLLADLATNTLPSAEYTMLIAPDANNAPPANSPGGAGYALITNYAGTPKNPASATAKITGALADGTAFNQTVPVSQDGYIPIYANLYANKGLLLGWINLDLTNTAGVSLTWIHPARPSGLYQQGFTNILLTNQILLSPWTNPPGNLVQLTNLSMLDTIDDTNALTNITVTTTAAGKVTGPEVSGSINLKTGLLKVTIGSGASKVTGYGAILLNITNGGGYFLTKTNAPAIKLRP